MTDPSAFGKTLGACRRSAGLSQQELAERSGLSIRAISNLERGRARWPHPGTVRRLAVALGLSDDARTQFLGAAVRRPVPAADAPAADAPAADAPPTVALADQLPSADRGPVVPRQMPAPVRQFVGRQTELASLTRPLGPALTCAPTAMMTVVVSGTAGVGKTALALYWAHQVASRFPDGQLYVNLQGFGPSGTPTEPALVVRGFLDGLGVAKERIPAGLDAQAALYRSLLVGKQMLVVLDNARDEAQVRPLLPGSAGCLVIVTSRSQLAGLATTDGAQLLSLGVLDEVAAAELVTARLGSSRTAADPRAVSELVRLCARLPLALAIAAARADTRPELPLAALADELRDSARRLDALDTGDPAASIRAVFSWSYRALTQATARMFRLLGVHPGPDITIPAAASLAGLPAADARRALAELTRTHLVSEHPPGRFSCHDLLRAYTAEQASELSEAERQAATHRMLDHYLHTAYSASCLIHPHRDPIARHLSQPVVCPEKLDGRQQAMGWFRAERHVLLGVTQQAAADDRFSEHAWQLPWAMAMFLNWDGYWTELVTSQEAALAASRRVGDHAGQAEAHRFLGLAHVRLGVVDEGTSHLAAVLELGRQLGSSTLQARAHLELGRVDNVRGRSSDALDHAEQALRLYQAAGYRAGQASTLNFAGWSCALLGRYQEALHHCEKALELHRELGNKSGEAATLDSLGYAHHELGNYAQAISYYQESIEAFGGADDAHHRAEAFNHLGDAHQRSGDAGAARHAWHQALNILEGLQHPDAEQVRARLARR